MVLPKISECFKTFIDKCKDKNKDNNLMSLYLDDDKLLEKYKTIWTKIEDPKNIELEALPVYDGRYIKTKQKTHGSEVYTTFGRLNVSKDNAECEYFTVISIHSLLVYDNKYYQQIYLDTNLLIKF